MSISFYFGNWRIIAYNVMSVSAAWHHESAVSVRISALWSLPLTPPSTPPGHHGALSGAPGVMQQLPVSCLFYPW